MKLKTLEIRNFKSIRSAKINPSTLTAITGLNGLGKSNTLDAVWFLFKGSVKGYKNSELIRDGTTQAEITITISSDGNFSDSKSSSGQSSNSETISIKKIILPAQTKSFLNGHPVSHTRLMKYLNKLQLLAIRQGTVTQVIKNDMTQYLYDTAGCNTQALINKYEQSLRKENKLKGMKQTRLRAIQPYLEAAKQELILEESKRLNKAKQLKIKESIANLVALAKWYVKNKTKELEKTISEPQGNNLEIDYDTLVKMKQEKVEIEEDEKVNQKILTCLQSKRNISSDERKNIILANLGELDREKNDQILREVFKNCDKKALKDLINSDLPVLNFIFDEKHENELSELVKKAPEICKKHESQCQKTSSCSICEVAGNIKGLSTFLSLERKLSEYLTICTDRINDLSELAKHGDVIEMSEEKSKIESQISDIISELLEQSKKVGKGAFFGDTSREKENFYQNLNQQENNENILKEVENARALPLIPETYNFSSSGTDSNYQRSGNQKKVDLITLRTRGRVHELFTVPEKYKTAVDAVLGGRRNFWIVESAKDLNPSGAKSDNITKLHGTFIPLDKIQKTKVVDSSVLNQIQFDEKDRSAFEFLLGGVKLVHSASENDKATGMTVDLSGTIYDPRGSLTGGKFEIRNDKGREHAQIYLEKVEETVNALLNLFSFDSYRYKEANSKLQELKNILEEISYPKESPQGFKASQTSTNPVTITQISAISNCISYLNQFIPTYNTNLNRSKEKVAQVRKFRRKLSFLESQIANHSEALQKSNQSADSSFNDMNMLRSASNAVKRSVNLLKREIQALQTHTIPIQTKIVRAIAQSEKNQLKLAQLCKILVQVDNEGETFEQRYEKNKKRVNTRDEIAKMKEQLDGILKSENQQEIKLQKTKKIRNKSPDESNEQSEEENCAQNPTKNTHLNAIFTKLDNLLDEKFNEIQFDLKIRDTIVEYINSHIYTDQEDIPVSDSRPFDKNTQQKIKRSTLLPPLTILSSKITELNSNQSDLLAKLNTTNSLKVDKTVYTESLVSLEDLNRKLEQLERDRTTICKMIKLALKDVQSRLGGLVKYVNQNVNQKIHKFIKYISVEIEEVKEKPKNISDDNLQHLMTESSSMFLKVYSNGSTVSINELSGGQKSLIAIAIVFVCLEYEVVHGDGQNEKDKKLENSERAIPVERKNTNKPPILCLLDEIDSALDPAQTELVSNFLRSQNIQTLVVSLKDTFVSYAERVFEVYRDCGTCIRRVK